MITYHYRCTFCDNEFEVQQSIKDNSLTKCHCCQQHRLERVIHNCDAFVRQEATTVGQIADRNTKKMGTYEKQAKNKAYKDSQKAAKLALKERAIAKGASVPDLPEDRPTPVYGKVDHDKINNMNKKQVEKYIMEGK